MSAIENDIGDAIVNVVKTVTGLYVHRGITAGILNSSERPVACVLLMGHADTVKVFSKKHDIALDVAIYIETADVQNADAALVEIIQSITTALYQAELLPTIAVPTGLLLMPMWVKGSRRIVDPSGDAGIGSAELSVEAVYRVRYAA